MTAYLRAHVAHFVTSGRLLLPLSATESQSLAARLEQPTLDAVRKALTTDLSQFDANGFARHRPDPGPELRESMGLSVQYEAAQGMTSP